MERENMKMCVLGESVIKGIITCGLDYGHKKKTKKLPLPLCACREREGKFHSSYSSCNSTLNLIPSPKKNNIIRSKLTPFRYSRSFSHCFSYEN